MTPPRTCPKCGAELPRDPAQVEAERRYAHRHREARNRRRRKKRAAGGSTGGSKSPPPA